MATEGDISSSDPFAFLNQGLGFLNNLSNATGGGGSSGSGSGTSTESSRADSSVSQTVYEEVSPEKATALIQQMLESVTGLGAISSMARTSGVYNSTTQQQLSNDLASRVAGQVAALSSRKFNVGNSSQTSNANKTTISTEKKKSNGLNDVANIAGTVASILSFL